MPQVEHVHLGFVNGAIMRDPQGLMDGAGITVNARWLTFVPGDEIDPAVVGELLREGGRVAAMSGAERMARAFDHDAGPEGRD
jgi:hypothetical protein